MNNIRIVPMTADHLDALEQLERTCFSRPWSRKMLAEELDNQCAAFLVAEDAATGPGDRLCRAAGGRRRGVYHQRGGVSPVSPPGRGGKLLDVFLRLPGPTIWRS